MSNLGDIAVIDGIKGRISHVKEVKPRGKKGYRFYFRRDGIRDEKTNPNRKKLEEIRKIYLTLARDSELDIQTRATQLSQEQVNHAWLAYKELEANNYVNLHDDLDAPKLVSAIKYFINNYRDEEEKPNVRYCYDLFMKKQMRKKLSPISIRNYEQQLGKFVDRFSDYRIDQFNDTLIGKYVYEPSGDQNRFNRYNHIHSFFAYCCGKKNIEQKNGWIREMPFGGFDKPEITAKDIISLNYKEMVKVLKRANEIGNIGYFIFRLFSCIRTEEYDRFIELSGDLKNNRYINIEGSNIHLNSYVYQKRNQRENRGRNVPIHPTFKKWILYFNKNNISIKTSRKKIEKALDEYDHRNIMRDTSITFHLKCFQNIEETATLAGNSDAIIRKNYFNVNIPKIDAEKIYNLTPQKCKKSKII